MLFSPAGRIAIAHYPKTAGTSLTAWFRELFPDAAYPGPDQIHMPVRASLERLGLLGSGHSGAIRKYLKLIEHIAPKFVTHREKCDVKIVGVVREPFEMLVSLYEYWQRCDFAEEPKSKLIQAARFHGFREFLRLAVERRKLPTYEKFFDVGGPAWKDTRLLDFHSLKPAIIAVCEEFHLAPQARLQRLNVAPRRARDLEDYVTEAGGLVFKVRKYFRWYYEEAGPLLIRGAREAMKQAA